MASTRRQLQMWLIRGAPSAVTGGGVWQRRACGTGSAPFRRVRWLRRSEPGRVCRTDAGGGVGDACAPAPPRTGAGPWSLAAAQGGRTPGCPRCPDLPAAAGLPALPWRKTTVLLQLTLPSAHCDRGEALGHLFLQKAGGAEVSPGGGCDCCCKHQPGRGAVCPNPRCPWGAQILVPVPQQDRRHFAPVLEGWGRRWIASPVHLRTPVSPVSGHP